MKQNTKKESGYTIIETMIAVSVFLVVVTIGIGALLNANLLHQKSQSMRSITDNLSFIMEDMSRNLRTGYNYRCYFAVGGDISPGFEHIPRSCPSGWGIAFEPANGDSGNNNDQWIYYAAIDNSVNPPKGRIYKSTKGASSASNYIQLTPNEVDITNLSYVFSVLGAEPPLATCGAPSSDCQQPLINIRLVGNITFKGVVTPFSLQTTVSQRKVDI